MGREGLKVLAGTFAKGMGRELGTWCLDFWGGKERNPVRRGGERGVPHWVRRDEGARKSDAKACLFGQGERKRV